MPDHLDHTILNSTLAELGEAPYWHVGFSGGLDSSVLLHLLQRWCKANPDAPPLSAIHINHGLQEQADEWQSHCEWLCRFLQLPCIAERVIVDTDGKGVEATAREARYGVFSRHLQPGDVLFLAHHLDDQVETFFLRLLRGAGVQGLAAMPARRPLGQGSLVRPLLQVPRAELETYAARHGLQYIEDPSNRDTAMDRNFLRRELLPQLAGRWPAYRQTVTRASEHLAAARDALAEAMPAPPTVRSVMGDPGVELVELQDVPAEVAATRLRNWLAAGGYPAPDQARLLEFLRQLRDAGEDANPQLRSSAYCLQLYRGAIYLYLAETVASEAMLTIVPGERLRIAGTGQVALESEREGGLSLQPGDRLEVRRRRGGERCRPLGRSHSNALKKLLQEEAVPPWWRERLPLLFLGDELLAVGGLWCCHSERLCEQPQRGGKLWQLRFEPMLPPGFD